MHEKEILAIHKFIDDSLFKPEYNWPEHHFNERSYSRWAANEILTLITNYDLISPISVVSDFINKMDAFLDMREGTEHEIIYSIARDMGYDILDVLILLEFENGGVL